MTENENRLPAVPTYEQLEAAEPDILRSRKWFGTDTTGLLLDFAKPYNPPRWTLSHNGIPFAKIGDLHIVSGKSGHGKTAFMSQIIATLICKSFGGMASEMKLDQPPVVLYIDTEQSEDDSIAIKNRICTIAGLNPNERSEQFLFARLRETETPDLRYNQILQLIWDNKPNIVFIDGALDLVADYNDQSTCSQLIRDMMIMATKHNISTWVVMHENPTTDKLVGSLGSIAERKVTEVFKIHKYKFHDLPDKLKNKFRGFPDVFFEVKQMKARGKDQDDWYFGISNDKYTWGTPYEIGYEEPATRRTIDEVKQWLTEGQHEIDWPATRTQVQTIWGRNGITSLDEQKELTEMAINRRYLIEQTADEMMPNQKNPRLKLNENEILPFN